MAEAIDSIRAEAPHLEHVIVIGEAPAGTTAYSDWIAAQSPDCQTFPTHREDYATLNYSSGTTGQPKGILHAHKDLIITSVLWGQNVLGLKESDRTFALAKLFFTFGTGGNLLMPWSVGASTVLYAGSPRVATNVLSMIDEFKPTIFYNAPTGYAMTLAMPDFTETYDVSSLRLCVSAGEKRCPRLSGINGKNVPESTSSMGLAPPRSTISSSPIIPMTSNQAQVGNRCLAMRSALWMKTMKMWPRARLAISS